MAAVGIGQKRAAGTGRKKRAGGDLKSVLGRRTAAMHTQSGDVAVDARSRR